jgi:hypothetical protein
VEALDQLRKELLTSFTQNIQIRGSAFDKKICGEKCSVQNIKNIPKLNMQRMNFRDKTIITIRFY